MPESLRTAARYLLASIAATLLASCVQTPPAPKAARADEPRTYGLVYTIAIAESRDGTARASIRVEQDTRRLRELRFDADPERFSDFEADGELAVDDGRVTWQPPRRGGTLSYTVRLSHQRRNGAFDARMTDDWALFRGGDVFPPAATRTVVGATSVARLNVELPDDWSALTPYLTGDSDFSFPIRNTERRFDRPTGWILLGHIGVRRGRIADTRVAIGAPIGEGVRRMDIMAFLNWTLPALRETFPTLDQRLVIVSAGDPMWRGGLSGPASLYIHADRPMISENGTSSMLHELVHVAMSVAGSDHDDWLVEGLAEYYSIKILGETGSLSQRRRELALEDLAEWGEPVENLFVRRSSGAVTARATTLLAELDAFLIDASGGRRSLDDVVRRMIATEQPYSYGALCRAARAVAGKPAPLLDPPVVPGAPDEPACRLERRSG